MKNRCFDFDSKEFELFEFSMNDKKTINSIRLLSPDNCFGTTIREAHTKLNMRKWFTQSRLKFNHCIEVKFKTH